MTFPECLRQRQLESGLSQSAFCDTLDINHSAYHAYINGVYKPSPHVYDRIVNIIKYDPDESPVDVCALKHFVEFKDTLRVFIYELNSVERRVGDLLANEFNVLLRMYIDDLKTIKIKNREK